MTDHPLLAPLVALVLWTLVMMVWMAVVRFAAFRKLGVTLGTIPAGSRGSALDETAPRAQWPAHNYAHLVEQPTIFYATVLALVAMGFEADINVWLAWGYVGLRVLHSLVQATYNKVAHRLALFVLSSLCLLALAIHAALYLSHH
jgi:hypothetical protein